MKTTTASIELLEARIAPAAVFVNSSTATYDDVDGDHVTVKFTKPILTSGVGGNLAAVFTFNAAGYLADLDLTASTSPDGTGVAFTVSKVAGGDGLANVGYINATGHNLGAVAVKGDLGQIDAGTDAAGTDAIKSLTVRSMGRLGTDTQGAGSPSLQSDIKGVLGAFTAASDVQDVLLNVTGTNGSIGPVAIGGSLIGGGAKYAGEISSSGNIGATKIGHDVQGGSGVDSGNISSSGKLASLSVAGSVIGGSNSYSGAIDCDDLGGVKIGHNVEGGSGDYAGLISSSGNLPSVTIGGSLIGGLGGDSGQVYSAGAMGPVQITHDILGGAGYASGYVYSTGTLASASVGGSVIGGGPGNYSGLIQSVGAMGAVKIAHDLRGGSGQNSGVIDSGGTLAAASIGGSLIGGSNEFAGGIYSNADMGAVNIGHDFIGSSINGSDSVNTTGVIQSKGRIASVTIGGSIISGIDKSSGSIVNSTAIQASDDIGALTVKGSIIGHRDTGTGASPVTISARGQHLPLPAGARTDLAIGKITIGGRVEFTNFLAGYNFDFVSGLQASNGDAQVGAVKVGGDWIASNLVAGTKNTASGNQTFGDANDASIGAGNASIFAEDRQHYHHRPGLRHARERERRRPFRLRCPANRCVEDRRKHHRHSDQQCRAGNWRNHRCQRPPHRVRVSLDSKLPPQA